jgi:hypothetical protein
VQPEGFSPGAFLRPLLMDSHSPHACSTREYTPSLSHSPSTASPPSQGLDNRPDQEFSELCSWCWTLSGRKPLPNKLSLQEPSYAHYSRTLIPHMPVPPGSIHLHCHTVHRLLHLPLRVSATGQIRNSQSSVAGAGLSLGENHFPTNSLSWRELLTGLTTCLFNHGPDNPLLQPVSTQFPQGKDNNNNNNIRLTHG